MMQNNTGGFNPQNAFINAPHLDTGGMPTGAEMAPWYVRQAERGASMTHESGLLNSAVPGRTDQLNKMVPAGAYVIPADVVSGIGEGNTMAGANVLQHAMSSGPHGVPVPNMRSGRGIPSDPAPYNSPQRGPSFAQGGSSNGHVPVVLAGGEFVVHPDDVKRIGNGDIKKGHRVLDAFVLHARKQTIKQMSKLKGPVK